MEREYKWVLAGNDLTLMRNVVVEFDSENRVVSLEEVSHDISNNLLLSPAHFNAHVHAADIELRGRLGRHSLAELVGPGGIKQRHLSTLSQDGVKSALRQSLQEAMRHGTGGWADFREGGVYGFSAYPISEVGEFLAFGRPTEPDISEFSRLGIRDVLAVDEELLDLLKHRGGRPLFIHVSEDKELRDRWIRETGMSDVEWAIRELEPDALVHLTHADHSDIDLMARENIPGIICVGSNQFTGVGIPPLEEMIAKGITIGIGTDNAMFQPLSLWSEMRRVQDMVLDARQIYKMATVNAAQLCGLHWGIEVGSGNTVEIRLPGGTPDPLEWLVSHGDFSAITRLRLSPSLSI